MPRLALGLGASVLGLLVVAVVNAGRLPSRQPGAVAAPALSLDDTGVVNRLSRAITIRTTNRPEPNERDEPHRGAEAPSPAAFSAFHTFHRFLREAYPSAHAQLDVERIADLSLLYTWRGTEPDAPPVVLMGHQDVVEAGADTEALWQHPPFAGQVAGGFVWGRGALDDKSSVLATLEAVELLLAERFVPRRTIHLAFGHDEESGGRGARAMLAALRERGVDTFTLVLDEGGAILPGSRIPGVDQPVGLIGIAEKRALNLELVATAEAGHASSPPATSAIGRLGRAIARLEAHPPPARVDGATAEMLRFLAPEMTLGPRLLFANLWLSRPLVRQVMAGSPGTAPVVRTTIAPTVIRAGAEVNVLPETARATLNVRLLPGDTTDDVVRHISRVIDDDRIAIGPPHVLATGDAPVSDVSTPGFMLLAETVRQIHGAGTLVAPYLTIAAVDARWYAVHSRHVYRFRGVRWEADATQRIHGIDERIAVDAYLDGIRFMYRLIQNANHLE